MAYATVTDVQARMTNTLTDEQEQVCVALLDDAAALIDATNTKATDAQKKTVSCSMVIRAFGSSANVGIPMGATQGSASGLGYSQSWTIGNGASGELYLSKSEKRSSGLRTESGPIRLWRRRCNARH